MTEEFKPEETGSGSPYPMEEKVEEKEHEKVEEKHFHEKGRRDPLGNIIWAGILIWAGLVLLANNLGVLNNVPILSGMAGWSLVFAGAGAILILEVFFRLFVPRYRQPVIGTMIMGLILMSIGLGDSFGWDLIWPIILIAVGLSVILGGFIRRT
ncbi:MAG: hypothetical protein JXA25_08430 [Anaerolineales bacterium]|nr:hypothetical protein [Anaerolineales bacterium]